MEVKDLIYTLGHLESLGVLNPSEIISKHGLDKVAEAVVSYRNGISYGIPHEHSLRVFDDLLKSEEKVITNYFISEEKYMATY